MNDDALLSGGTPRSYVLLHVTPPGESLRPYRYPEIAVKRTSNTQRHRKVRLRFTWLAASFGALLLAGVLVIIVPASEAGATYNGAAAAEWAITHAKDPQIAADECAWFVSQALWAGGLPQSAQWNGTSSHELSELNGSVTGSVTAWVVPQLVTYLRDTFHPTWNYLGHMSTNAVSGADIGDLIVYSWGGNSTLNHVAIITGFQGGGYPLVSEMGQLTTLQRFFSGQSNYVQRGWTWSQESNKWLEVKYPGATAYLLHFNSTTSPTSVSTTPTTTAAPSTSVTALPVPAMTTTTTNPPTSPTTPPTPITETPMTTPSTVPSSGSPSIQAVPGNVGDTGVGPTPTTANDTYWITPTNVSELLDSQNYYEVDFNYPVCTTENDSCADGIASKCVTSDPNGLTASQSWGFDNNGGQTLNDTPDPGYVQLGYDADWSGAQDSPPEYWYLSPGDTYECEVQLSNTAGEWGPEVWTAPFTVS